MSERAVAYGDTISLRYAIRFRDGTEIISNFEEPEPDVVTVGDGTLAQTLEQWLIGLKPGDRNVFLLDPWQAFGASSEEMIKTLGASEFPADMPLEPGLMVEFEMPNGQTMAGTILEIGPDAIKVDFNHPLADCPIEFEVEVEAFHLKDLT